MSRWKRYKALLSTFASRRSAPCPIAAMPTDARIEPTDRDLAADLVRCGLALD
jgi:hypothetical protein